MRAVLGFLARDDRRTTSRDTLKSEGERFLHPRLAEIYSFYVDYVEQGRRVFDVKGWVTFYLVKMRELERVELILEDVLSSTAIDEMAEQNFLEYWSYAETLNL